LLIYQILDYLYLTEFSSIVEYHTDLEYDFSYGLNGSIETAALANYTCSVWEYKSSLSWI